MDQHNSHDKEPSTMVVNDQEAAGQQKAYTAYGGTKFDFDPLKDLNLPGSYKEVMERLDRLQVDRNPSALN